MFYDLLEGIISYNVPTVSPKFSTFPMWYDKDCIDAYYDKRRAHRKFKRSKLECDKVEFSVKRNVFKNIIDTAYMKYMHSLQENLCSDLRRFFHFVQTKSKGKRIPNTMQYEDSVASDSNAVANLFSKFFQESLTLDDDIPDAVLPSSTTGSSPCLNITRDEIEEKLSTLKQGKPTGSDPVPTSIVVQCAREFSAPLLYNL